MGEGGQDVAFVINPRSANGATLRRFERERRSFERALGALDVRLTERPGHATEIVRGILRERPRCTIVAVGGDGTNNEVVNGFFDDDGAPLSPGARLAVVVSGTGGDFRRTLGWSTDPAEALRRIVDGVPRAIDVGKLTYIGHDGREASRMFLNIASFGVSGAVDDVVNRSSKALGARPSFLIGTLRAFASYTPKRVRVEVDGVAREAPISCVAVANGQYFGGGMRIAPAAALDDGLFDVVTVEGGIGTFILNAPKVYSGRHVEHASVHVERGREVVASPLTPGERVLIDLDGEQPGILPARFTILPGALTLLAGR